MSASLFASTVVVSLAFGPPGCGSWNDVASGTTAPPGAPSTTDTQDDAGASSPVDEGTPPAPAAGTPPLAPQGDASAPATTDFITIANIPVVPPYVGIDIGQRSDLVIQGRYVVVSNARQYGFEHQNAAAARSTTGTTVSLYGPGIASLGPLTTNGQSFYFSGLSGGPSATSNIYKGEGGTFGLSPIGPAGRVPPWAVDSIATAIGDTAVFIAPTSAFSTYDPTLVGQLAAAILDPVRDVGGVANGSAERLTHFSRGVTRRMVTRGSTIVYCDSINRAVMKLPKAGGVATTLVPNTDCTGLAAAESGDLLVAHGGTDLCVTEVLRVDPSDVASVLATNMDCLGGIALDAQYAYVSIQRPTQSALGPAGQVLRIPLATPSAPLIVASGQSNPAALAVSNGAVYFVTGQGVRRTTLP